MQGWLLRTWQLQQELLAGSTRCAWRPAAGVLVAADRDREQQKAASLVKQQCILKCAVWKSFSPYSCLPKINGRSPKALRARAEMGTGGKHTQPVASALPFAPSGDKSLVTVS